MKNILITCVFAVAVSPLACLAGDSFAFDEPPEDFRSLPPLHASVFGVYHDTVDDFGAGIRFGLELPKAPVDLFGEYSVFFPSDHSEVHTLGLGAKLLPFDRDNRFQPYAIAAVDYTLESDWHVAGGAGLQWRLTNRLDLFGEYQYRWTMDTEGKTFAEDSNRFLLGLSFRF